jgi:hypothetical protein
VKGEGKEANSLSSYPFKWVVKKPVFPEKWIIENPIFVDIK